MEDVAGPVVAAIRAAFGAGSLPGLASDVVVADPDGWIPASALVDGGVGALLDAGRRHWPAPPHVSAALLWKAYSYWLALPVAFSWVAARRVPHVTAYETLVRLDAPQAPIRLGLRSRLPISVLPGDPLAGGAVVAGEGALLTTLRRVLLEEHVDPLLEAVRSRVRISRRALLGSLAANVAHTARHAARAVGSSGPEAVGTLLAALDLEPLVDWHADPAGPVTVRRRTCCLAFTLPQPRICTDCCYTPSTAPRLSSAPRLSNASRNRSSASSGGPDAHPSSATTP